MPSDRRNESDAADVAQEAFVRAYRALPRFRGDSKFSSWLYRIAVNRALTHLARRKRRSAGDAEVADAADGMPAAEPFPAAASRTRSGRSLGGRAERCVREAVAKLPPRYRAVITLFYLEERSYKEVAGVLGVPVGHPEDAPPPGPGAPPRHPDEGRCRNREGRVKESCLDVILERRSAHRFKDQDVPEAVLDKVLTAALRAPTPGGSVVGGYRGSQPYSVIVVRDKSRRVQLNEMLTEGRRKSIEEAPVSLVFCVDTHRLNRWAALSGGAPHFNGIGILWVSLAGDVHRRAERAHRRGLARARPQYVQEIVWQPYQTLDFFRLPKQVLPVAMLIVGYPSERPPLAPSLPLEAVVHHETYKDPTTTRFSATSRRWRSTSRSGTGGLPPTSQGAEAPRGVGREDARAVRLSHHVHRELLQVARRHGADEPHSSPSWSRGRARGRLAGRSRLEGTWSARSSRWQSPLPSSSRS